jgi:agmatinase
VKPRRKRGGEKNRTKAADNLEDTFPFMSDATFLKAGRATATSELVVAGISWDGATTNRPGARHGPAAIRTASHMLADGTHPLFEVSPLDPRFRFGDAGDFMLPNTSLERMREALGPSVKQLLKRHRHIVFLGGDHSVTLPILRAYRAHLGRPLSVLHFDAHCDTWKDHFGEPSGHGTWVYEAIQEGLVTKECFFQVGIRSPGNREAREYVKSVGGMIFTARELRGLENMQQLAPVTQKILKRLEEHKQPPLYVTLDIDVLDPSVAPGTGTPEVGGLSTSQVLTLLEELLPRVQTFVGGDVVEVAPAYDHGEITSLAAATFAWTFLCAFALGAGTKK